MRTRENDFQVVPILRDRSSNSTTEEWIRSQAGSYVVCVGQCGIWTHFSHSTSVYPCQYNSANTPSSLVRLLPTLFNRSN
jgi:hypothetical protein